MTIKNYTISSAPPEIALLDCLLKNKDLDGLEQYFLIYPKIDVSNCILDGDSMWQNLLCSNTYYHNPELRFKEDPRRINQDNVSRYKKLALNIFQSFGDPLHHTNQAEPPKYIPKPTHASFVPNSILHHPKWRILTYQNFDSNNNKKNSLYPHFLELCLKEKESALLYKEWLDKYDYSHLHTALKNCDHELISVLLGLGFSPNLPIFHDIHHTNGGNEKEHSSPISICRDPTSLSLLLEAGSDPSINIFLNQKMHPLESWGNKHTHNSLVPHESHKDEMASILATKWQSEDDSIISIVNSVTSHSLSSLNQIFAKHGIDNAFKYKSNTNDKLPCAFSHFLSLNYSHSKPTHSPAKLLLQHLISKYLLLSKSTDGNSWLSHIMNHLSFGSTPTSIESFHKILTSTNSWKDTFFFSQDGKRLPSTAITDLQLNKFIDFCSSVNFKKPPLFFNINNEKSYFGNIFNFNGATLNLQISNSRNENLATDLKTIQDHLLNLYLSTVKHQLSGILKNPNSSKAEVFHFPIFNNVLNNTVNQIGTLFTEDDVKKQNLSISFKKISPLIIESVFYYFLSGPTTLNRYSYQKDHSFNSHELIFLSAAKHMKFKSEDTSTISQIAKHNLPSSLLGEFEKILLANSVKSSNNYAPTKSL